MPTSANLVQLVSNGCSCCSLCFCSQTVTRFETKVSHMRAERSSAGARKCSGVFDTSAGISCCSTALQACECVRDLRSLTSVTTSPRTDANASCALTHNGRHSATPRAHVCRKPTVCSLQSQPCGNAFCRKQRKARLYVRGMRCHCHSIAFCRFPVGHCTITMGMSSKFPIFDTLPFGKCFVKNTCNCP